MIRRPLPCALVFVSFLAAAPAAAGDPPGIVTFPPIDTRSFDELHLAGDGRYIALSVPRYAYQTSRQSFILIFDTATGQQVARIYPPAPDDMDAFGIQIEVSHGMLFATTVSDARFGLPGNPGGSISVFTFPEGDEITSFASPEPSGSDFFGIPVRAAGDMLVVGAPAEGYPEAGSGAIYTYSLPDLTLIQRIGGINTGENLISYPMTVNDRYIAAVLGTVSDTGPDDAVLVVRDVATANVITQAQPTLGGAPVTTASYDLAAGGRYAVVGDITDDRAGNNAGWVYVFDFETMSFVSSFGPPAGSDNWYFGIRMAMQGDFAAVSSPAAPTSSPWNEGRVDIVHVPTGTVVREIEAPGDGRDEFAALNDFGYALAFVGRGVAVTSNSFVAGTRLDYFPLPELCPADANQDGQLTPADLTTWLDAFNTGGSACDQNYDGLCSGQDFTAWIHNFNAGCQ